MITTKYQYLTLVLLTSLFITALIIYIRPTPISNKIIPPIMPRSTPLLTPSPMIKSVRVDLSSMPVPDDQAAFRRQIINQLTAAGANTVFINPWSDGRANYQSSQSPLSPLGQQQWLEQFITEAHTAHLQVYAWFVVGKDNFPAQQHPDWYARTINNAPYNQADEPGINLPFASLAHPDFIRYHLQVINEVNQLPLDGWVISEPLIGWGDQYDSFYTDFSPSALAHYQQQGISQPAQVIQDLHLSGRPSDLQLYQRLVNARAGVVTNFVAQTMQAIRHTNRPIIITIFTEPDAQGNLISPAAIKEWLGLDIVALSSLQPNIIEIQSLFLDFEYPQPPGWTASMLRQFKQQLNSPIPIAVSVQGFAGESSLPPAKFAAALSAAMQESPAGVSFYAYHTLTPAHWRQLTALWK